MKKTIKRELIIEKLENIHRDLAERSECAYQQSEKKGSGFPDEYFIQKYGISLGFQWSAQELGYLIEELKK